MTRSVQQLDSSNSSDSNRGTYKTALEVLEDVYATVNGDECPRSAVHQAVHPSDRPALSELFPSAFVEAHTEYATWAALAAAAPFELATPEQFATASKTEVDQFVRTVTTFQSGTELVKAATEWVIESSTSVVRESK
jgi:hypothetical protein